MYNTITVTMSPDGTFSTIQATQEESITIDLLEDDIFDIASLSKQERLLVSICMSSQMTNESITARYLNRIVPPSMREGSLHQWNIISLLTSYPTCGRAAKQEMVEELKIEVLQDIVLLKQYLHDCHGCSPDVLHNQHHAGKGIRYEMWTLRCLLAKKELEHPEIESISHLLPHTETYINFSDLSLPERLIVQVLFTEHKRKELGVAAKSMEHLSSIVYTSDHFNHRCNVYHFIELYMLHDKSFLDTLPISAQQFIAAMRAETIPSSTLLKVIRSIERIHGVSLVSEKNSATFDTITHDELSYTAKTPVDFTLSRNVYIFFKDLMNFRPGYLESLGVEQPPVFLKEILSGYASSARIVSLIRQVEAEQHTASLATSRGINRVHHNIGDVVRALNMTKREDIYYLFTYISTYYVGWLKAVGVRNPQALLQDIVIGRINTDQLQHLLSMAEVRFSTTIFMYEEKCNTVMPSTTFLLEHLDFSSRRNIHYLIKVLAARHPELVQKCGIKTLDVFLDKMEQDSISRFDLVDILRQVESYFGVKVVQDLSQYATKPFSAIQEYPVPEKKAEAPVVSSSPLLGLTGMSVLSKVPHTTIEREHSVPRVNKLRQGIKKKIESIVPFSMAIPKKGLLRTAALTGTLLLTTSSIVSQVIQPLERGAKESISRSASNTAEVRNSQQENMEVTTHNFLKSLVTKTTLMPSTSIFITAATSEELASLLNWVEKVKSLGTITPRRMETLVRGAMNRGVSDIPTFVKRLDTVIIRQGEGVSQAHLRHLKNIYGDEWKDGIQDSIIDYYASHTGEYSNHVEAGGTFVLPRVEGK